jgi:hypothetical protein
LPQHSTTPSPAEGQLVPQDPQWAGSRKVSTQEPLQQVRSRSQVRWHPPQFASVVMSMHAPSQQASFEAQAMPQAPQLSSSLRMSEQVPSQSVVVPAGQQVPPAHVSFSAQALPQLPQFRESMSRSRHVPEQQVCPSGQR